MKKEKKKAIKENKSNSSSENKKKSFGRVPTGIPGFDDLVEGGFPQNASILVCGGPGTGKTIFCMEYLIRGIMDFNEKGLYVTFEQRADALREQGKQFGWDLEALEKKGMLKILAVPAVDIKRNIIDNIRNIVKKEGIKRLVVDSLSTLVVNAPIYVEPNELAVKDVVGENVVFSPPIIGDYIVKRFIYDFIDELRELDATSLLISEASQGGEYITRDTLSEFVCDGVVLITFESMGGAYSRSLIIRKMRQTKNDEDVHPVEISKSGMIVHKIT
jgi:circadian clock protein KaiC